MQQLLDLLGISGLTPILKNRLILSSFCLLIFFLLIYFWAISRSKIKANNKDGSGLVYLSFSFLLCFLIGFVSVYHPIQNTYLVISALLSLCLLSSLSFFSIGTHPIDKIVSHPSWKNGIKYLGFGWVIIISMASGLEVISWVDIIVSVLAITLLGFFICRYFVRRGLNFIAFIAAGYFAIFILLQVIQPDSLSAGKFGHMNTIILGPSLLLAVIVLAYTFNWINELNFYELSNIWVSNDSSDESNQVAYAKLTQDANRQTWMEKIANDELEKVIEEVIILKKHKNENIEAILNIASRNTRNNNNHLKDLIKYEDYQLNRNKVSHSLMQLIRKSN